MSVRSFLLRTRGVWESIVLAHVLPFVAGAVNASGFFIVGAYTSHVTGSVARMGDDLAQGNVGGALQAGFLVLCFYVGAATATALLSDPARADRPGHYARPLTAEVATLLAVMLLGMSNPKSIPFLRAITTALLCFAMGVQNALVTRLSGAVVRTTHLTGIVTDMGIETVRAWAWLKKVRVERGLAQLLPALLRYRTVPELEKLRLHIAILFAFFLGACLGPYLYLRFGYASMLCPVLVLAALIALDHAIGLRARPPVAQLSVVVPLPLALPSTPGADAVDAGSDQPCPASRTR